MLFQGEEWGARAPFQYFVDFESEPDLARAVVDGRQAEFASFGWQPDEIPNPNDRATFERSKLSWNELSESEHQEMLAWHRDLIRLRRCVSAFTTGRLDYIVTDYSEADQWLCIERGPVTICCNFALDARTLSVAADRARHVLLASKPAEVLENTIVLPPESIAILGPQMEY
jgi:maltooligosyltrehalose trehalohydrolase